MDGLGASFWCPRVGFRGPGDPFRGDLGAKLAEIFLGADLGLIMDRSDSILG